MARCGSTVVEHKSHHPKVTGLSQADVSGAGRNTMGKKYFLKSHNQQWQRSGRTHVLTSQGQRFEYIFRLLTLGERNSKRSLWMPNLDLYFKTFC